MCDTLVKITKDGVLFAKNSDRDPNESQMVEWYQPDQHNAGSNVRCTWIDIPQVEHTYGVVISRPFWMWGAEIGTNEFGLTIGNEAVFTKQPYAATGLTGMDLVRLALERSRNVREGINTIVELIETHGQGGGCGHEDRSFTYHNSFLLADRNGAAVVETAGTHYAIELVNTGVRSISNGLTIQPFATHQSDPIKSWVAACSARRALTEHGATQARSVLDVFAILRSHGRSEMASPHWSRTVGSMSTPCMHAGGAIASSQTTASWVADLRTLHDEPVHWVTATSTPCTSIFKPIRQSAPYWVGPQTTDRCDLSTLWWRHEVFARRVCRDYPAVFARFRHERDCLEQSWVDHPPDAAVAFAEADKAVQRWLEECEHIRIDDDRPLLVRRYWQRRDALAALARSRDGSA